jgi:hypothetical protein
MPQKRQNRRTKVHGRYAERVSRGGRQANRGVLRRPWVAPLGRTVARMRAQRVFPFVDGRARLRVNDDFQIEIVFVVEIHLPDHPPPTVPPPLIPNVASLKLSAARRISQHHANPLTHDMPSPSYRSNRNRF